MDGGASEPGPAILAAPPAPEPARWHFWVSHVVLLAWAFGSILAMINWEMPPLLRIFLPLGIYLIALGVWWLAKMRVAVPKFWGQTLYTAWFMIWLGYGAWITWGYPPSLSDGSLDGAHPLTTLLRFGGDGFLSAESSLQKLVLGFDRKAVHTTVLSAVCIFLFTVPPAFAHSWNKARKARHAWYHEIANDNYYMGFLLTLAGLSSALMGMKFGDNAALLSDAIAKCGGAISTTFVAIVLRVVLIDIAELGDKDEATQEAVTQPGNGKVKKTFDWRTSFAFRRSEPDCCLPPAAACKQCSAVSSLDQLKLDVAEILSRPAPAPPLGDTVTATLADATTTLVELQAIAASLEDRMAAMPGQTDLLRAELAQTGHQIFTRIDEIASAREGATAPFDPMVLNVPLDAMNGALAALGDRLAAIDRMVAALPAEFAGTRDTVTATAADIRQGVTELGERVLAEMDARGAKTAGQPFERSDAANDDPPPSRPSRPPASSDDPPYVDPVGRHVRRLLISYAGTGVA